MTGSICIHGHFYQPPREDPWTRGIIPEPSARPYPNWNERIFAECYQPFTDARVLAPDGLIAKIINLFGYVSFNCGYPLLSWLETVHPGVYQKVIEGDRDAVRRFGGHGTALAMPFYHLILPLARPDDRRLVIRWGIDDFEARFSRKPEGMWLPETAVDVLTLEDLALEGITFTVLAPHQAARVKPPGGEFSPVPPGGLITTEPYLCRLPSGNSITIFFYDGAVASEIAFGPLLTDGRVLAERLARPLQEPGMSRGLENVAVDGETFGHHKPFGEMALAYALQTIMERGTPVLTTYGEYLEKNPPVREVEIVNNSSWSCIHSLCRWKGGCDCATDGRPGWAVEWRAPLRDALDQIREPLFRFYQEEMSRITPDPGRIRSSAGTFFSSPGPGAADTFMDAMGISGEDARKKALQLLLIERHAIAMYTSDAWFFEDIGRIETVYGLRHAARALGLARELGGPAISSLFVSHLSKAKGNTSAYPDGALVWKEQVEPYSRSFWEIALHYAFIALLSGKGSLPTPGYTIITRISAREDLLAGGVAGAGTIMIRDDMTLIAGRFDFAAVASPVSGCRVIGRPTTGEPDPAASRKMLIHLKKQVNSGSLVHDPTTRPVGPGVLRELCFSPGESHMVGDLVLKRLERYLWELAGGVRDIPGSDLFGEGCKDTFPVLSDLGKWRFARRIIRILKAGEYGPETLEDLTIESKRPGWDPDISCVRSEAERLAAEVLTDFTTRQRDTGALEKIAFMLDVLEGLGIHPAFREAQDRLVAIRDSILMPYQDQRPCDDPIWVPFREILTRFGVSPGNRFP